MKPDLDVLENVFAELISAYENLKAEILIAEIQENSKLTINDFVISNKSTFSRPYRRDIIDVDNLINDDKLTLNLSRNGLYDTLPEGLFHAPKGTQDSSTYLSRRKTIKEEEQDARSFFAPFENEFFYQRLGVECHERELLDDFYNLNDSFLIDFWKIDDRLPENYKLKLIKLLPHSHKIAGDFELTRLCLEKILDEKVSFKKKFGSGKSKEIEPLLNGRKKGIQLGVDSVLNSDNSEVLNPELEVTIGPISEKKINNYLKRDGVLKFINTFYDYFIPIEIDVSTKFTVKKDVGFLLDEADPPLMGISVQI